MMGFFCKQISPGYEKRQMQLSLFLGLFLKQVIYVIYIVE